MSDNNEKKPNLLQLASLLMAGIVGSGSSGYLGVTVGENQQIRAIEDRMSSLDAYMRETALHAAELDARARWMARVELRIDKLDTQIDKLKDEMMKGG